MDLDELLDQYKALMVLHKYFMISAVVLLAVMIGFIVWGLFSVELRLILIITGAVFGVCGTVLYFAVHRLFIKTGNAFADYLKASGMSEEEIGVFTREKGVALPGFSNK